jgi:DHA1 family chloramphenicol resistance protein-like MFS transporter
MPLAIYVLGLAIFAQGTSELTLAGLLPELAADLQVSIPDAGLLISAFAVGMLVGAPILAVITLRWSRRTAMLTLLAIFALTHVVGALSPSYGLLLATRVAGAFVYAGFWAVAAVTAVGLVDPNARGKAMSIVAGGLTVATIVGLPAGTVIGQHFGWRAVFWAVAALSVVAMLGIATTIPRERPATTPQLRLELKAMVNPQLWLAYATTAVSTAALLITFSYLAPLLTGPTGLSENWVPIVLALYGVGALTGITIGGRTADRAPFTTLTVGITGVIALSAGVAIWAETPWIAVPAIALLGAFGFASNPAINTRVFTLAGAAPTLAAAFNISAFNIGITTGPWLGAITLNSGADYPTLAWLGAALATLALTTVAIAASRRPRHLANNESDPQHHQSTFQTFAKGNQDPRTPNRSSRSSVATDLNGSNMRSNLDT